MVSPQIEQAPRTPEPVAPAAPAWDWRRAPYRGDTDRLSARLSRMHRTAARLNDLAGWYRALRDLPHFDPAYPYDPAHEYEADWISDPDYTEDARRLESSVPPEPEDPGL